MRQAGLCVLCIVLVLALCQCSDSPTNSNSNPQYSIADLTVDDHDVLNAGAEFAPEIFRRVCEAKGPNENVFISPLSISIALGMTHAGAAGRTRDEIHETLRLPADMTLEQINTSYRSIMRVLPGLDPATQVSLANAIWYRQDRTLRSSFEAICSEYFDATAEGVDFADIKTLEMINGWVSDKTNGTIDEIITPPIDPNLVALLVNAIYFKGSWTHSFDTENTESKAFMRFDGSQTTCDMMYMITDSLRDPITGQQDTSILHANTDLFNAASLPYGNRSLRMTILVPHRNHNTSDIIVSLSEDTWAEWLGLLQSRPSIEIYLPRFRFSFDTLLNDQLIAMGMSSAFSPIDANFDSLFVDSDPYVEKVLHKSFVQVDENGTEAAAVTAVFMDESAKPYVDCDRPFVFVIHESTTGAILFIGRLADPLWEE
ncbi:hypothetical protein GF356_05540 [candidate division GN15 bacterium]|nr:hypothetical protein [candidate division GN15 bacterium]